VAEIILAVYVVVGVLLGAWIGFNGPIRPDNVGRASALLCIVVLWPAFMMRMMR
jgi:hypothetical protein